MGCEAIVSGDENELRAAERLVLPGVGAFGACMRALNERGFDRLVRERGRRERRCWVFVSECSCCLKSRKSLAQRGARIVARTRAPVWK